MISSCNLGKKKEGNYGNEVISLRSHHIKKTHETRILRFVFIDM